MFYYFRRLADVVARLNPLSIKMPMFLFIILTSTKQVNLCRRLNESGNKLLSATRGNLTGRCSWHYKPGRTHTLYNNVMQTTDRLRMSATGSSVILSDMAVPETWVHMSTFIPDKSVDYSTFDLSTRQRFLSAFNFTWKIVKFVYSCFVSLEMLT